MGLFFHDWSGCLLSTAIMTTAAVALWVCCACGSVLGLYDASVAMISGEL